MAPGAEILEFSPDAVYLISVDINVVSREVGDRIGTVLAQLGIRSTIIWTTNHRDALKAYELNPDEPYTEVE